MKRGVKERLKKLIGPTVVEFDLHDLIQVIIGASIIAVPTGFQEEAWNIGGTIPLFNTFIIMIMTLFFISIFTYFHYHKEHLNANPKYHLLELTKRVVITYVFSFIVVAIFLSVIQITSWGADALISFKRVAVLTFPASIGAAVSDTIK
ncbi:MAG TPA: DUF2391 family protein [Candidatus Nanoarchaeia archaeon]|nr:DUF2391 family protein [Candidatus Nanoarchaeia archaeon]